MFSFGTNDTLVFDEGFEFNQELNLLTIFTDNSVRVVFLDEFDVTINLETFTVRDDNCCGPIPGVRIDTVSNGVFERIEAPFFGYRIFI